MAYIGNAPAAGIISGDNIQDSTVGTADLSNSAVTTAKLADAAVTTAKIADGAVVTADIADAAVTTAKVADGAVTSAKLASGAAVANIGYTPANKAGETFTGGVAAPSMNINGSAATWAPTTFFPHVIKGLGDGGFRALAVVGHATASSSWFGSTSSPQFAIDTKNGGGAEFWANNGSSWYKMIDFTYNGATNFYGGNGGTAINLYNGGDLTLWNAANTVRADMWGEAGETGMDTGSGYIWIQRLANRSQHTSYDRQWNNEPSITVCNNTEYGSQSTFRIHGAPGVSGGDYSVNLVVDGSMSSSDRRKKTEIQPIQNALSKVCQLQGVSFYLVNSDLQIQTHMSDAGGRKFGLIAQDTQPVAPEMTLEFTGEVATPKENGWCDGFSVDYQGAVGLLVEAIKELKAEFEAYKEAHP